MTIQLTTVLKYIKQLTESQEGPESDLGSIQPGVSKPQSRTSQGAPQCHSVQILQLGTGHRNFPHVSPQYNSIQQYTNPSNAILSDMNSTLPASSAIMPLNQRPCLIRGAQVMDAQVSRESGKASFQILPLGNSTSCGKFPTQRRVLRTRQMSKGYENSLLCLVYVSAFQTLICSQII